MLEALNFFLLNNSREDYLWALIFFFLLIIAFKVFQNIILGRLERLAGRTKTDLDETFIKILRKLRPPFYIFLSFYLASQMIFIPAFLDKVLFIILLLFLAYQAFISLNILVDYAVEKYSEQEKNKGTKSAFMLIGKIIKGVLLVVIILFALSNLGVNVTSLMAGLGIGGIAIALAIQTILSDLLSSFAIYFDKPFVPGDFIIVGEDSGVVEHVGIKTTRIRSLRGEEIVISNQELTSTRIHNFKKLSERRVVFSFGLIYNTSSETLKKAGEIVKKIIDSVELARFDRVHFHNFGDSSLDFEAVYYLKSPDYNVYMDTNQEILFKIKDAFEEEGLEMAYPTRTLYIEK